MALSNIQKIIQLEKNDKIRALYGADNYYLSSKYWTFQLTNQVNAQKTVFPRSWKIMECSKRPSKYDLYINFLAKEDRISHHRKAQNKNVSVAQNKSFSVISKYHLSLKFFPQKRPHVPSGESSKQELFSNL